MRWGDVTVAPLDDDTLDAGARARNRAFRDDDDRRRFVGARVLLRGALAEHAGCAESQIEVHQRCDRCGGAHGAPTVTIAARPGPAVSMSHAGGIAVVAIAGAPVGVDVEPATGGAEVQRWVRTEAVLKATGHGLDVDPALVAITGPDGRPRLAEWRGPGGRPRLRIRDVRIPGHLVAVARAGRMPLRIDVAPMTLRRP